MNPFPESLWDFSLSIYAQSQMEALCLHLQDHRSINVNQLLWALWLDAQSRPFDERLWQQGVAKSQRAERWLVGPLRRVRRTLPKRKPWLGLRSAVKTWELQSEQRQLQALQTISDDFAGKSPAAEEVTSETTNDVTTYLSQLLAIHEPEHEQLTRIVTLWRAG